MKFPKIQDLFFRGICLAIESSNDEVRAVLVSRRGKKTVVMDYVAMTRQSQNDDLPGIEVLREIKDRLGCGDGIKSVFVSPVARSVIIPMNTEKVRSLKRPQLLEAVKWEVEPYTGISGQKAFTGLEAEIPKPEPGQIQEEAEETMVNVSVLEQNIYRAVRERFKMAGLKLVRVYPPEVCFYVPLLSSHEESDRGVLEIGKSYTTFAMMRGGEPKIISTMNITAEMIQDHLEGNLIPDLEENLRFTIGQTPKPHPVAITGHGGLDEEIVYFIDSLSPTGAEPLVMVKSAALTSAGQEESPVFAIAAGAAIRELSGGKLRYIGISDEVPLVTRVKQSAYLMPLAVTVVIFVGMLGHYQFMKVREANYKKMMEERKNEIQEKKKLNADSLKLDKEIDEIEEKIKSAEKRKKFATGEADLMVETTAVFLDAVAAHIPDSAGILVIVQDEKDARRFRIEGTATDTSSIGRFASGLYDSKAFKNVRVTEIGDGKSGNGMELGFKMEVEINPVKNEEADPA